MLWYEVIWVCTMTRIDVILLNIILRKKETNGQWWKGETKTAAVYPRRFCEDGHVSLPRL